VTERQKYTYFKEEKEDEISKQIFRLFVFITIFFYIVVLAFSYAFYSKYTYISISGISMQPTLNSDPIAVVNNGSVEELQDGVFIDVTRSPKYGDIIVIDANELMGKKYIIKRTIALGGDYVTIVKLPNENEFHVLRVSSLSGTPEILQEDYIAGYDEWYQYSYASTTQINGVTYDGSFYSNFNASYSTATYSVDGIGDSVIFFKVPDNDIFFLGDNRAHSTDARSVGTVSEEKIVGVVEEIVYNGSKQVNSFWWLNRLFATFRVFWKDILRFFGGNV
jgi:signal peptidase I